MQSNCAALILHFFGLKCGEKFFSLGEESLSDMICCTFLSRCDEQSQGRAGSMLQKSALIWNLRTWACCKCSRTILNCQVYMPLFISFSLDKSSCHRFEISCDAIELVWKFACIKGTENSLLFRHLWDHAEVLLCHKELSSAIGSGTLIGAQAVVGCVYRISIAVGFLIYSHMLQQRWCWYLSLKLKGKSSLVPTCTGAWRLQKMPAKS